MKEIRMKDENGTVYKAKGRLGSGIYCTVKRQEIYEGDILEITEAITTGDMISDRLSNDCDFKIESIKTYITDVRFENGSFVIMSGNGDDYDTCLGSWDGDSILSQPMFKTRII